MTKRQFHVIISHGIFSDGINIYRSGTETRKGGFLMDIAIIADDNKKELMAQFCIAYCGILSRHHICATHITGKYIADATGLEIETFLAGHAGGAEQIASRISYNEIDVLFYFRSTDPAKEPSEAEISLSPGTVM